MTMFFQPATSNPEYKRAADTRRESVSTLASIITGKSEPLYQVRMRALKTSYLALIDALKHGNLSLIERLRDTVVADQKKLGLAPNMVPFIKELEQTLDLANRMVPPVINTNTPRLGL